MQIATKTSKNTILLVATAAPPHCAPLDYILYVISPDSRSIRCANRDELPNASSHLRVHDLVPRDNIVCDVDRLETNRRLALVLKLLILAVSAAATVRRLL